MRSYFIKITQLIIGVCMWTFSMFHKVEIKVDKEFNISKNKKYLIVANHQSKLDPFLITAFLPGKSKFKLLPYRYLTTEDYMQNFLVRNILYAFGCFSVSKERNKNKKPLELAQKFIDKKQTVFIFPEGRINRNNIIDNSINLGIGAIYLEKNNPDLYILSAKISYQEEKIVLNYKKPFRHKKFPKNLKPLIEETMENVYG